MKLYDCKDIPNSQVTSFHELISFAQKNTKIKGITPEDYLIINLYLKGEAIYETNDEKVKIKPNFITVTHPHEEHILQLSNPNKQCTLIYTPDFINDFVNSFQKKDSFLLENPFNNDKKSLEFNNKIFTEKWDTVSLINNIYQMIGSNLNKDMKLLSEICFQEALLSIIKNEMFIRLQQKNEEQLTLGEKEESKNRIQLAINYINDNYNQNITIEQLAQISNLSKFHFSRLFKKYLGVSPYQYLANKRIENAKMYLKNSHLSVTEIAFEVGFSNLSTFARLFTKVTGISPTSFRRGR